MVALICFVLAVLASPFKSKSRVRRLEDNHDYESIQICRAVAKTGGALTSRRGAFQKPPKREDEL